MISVLIFSRIREEPKTIRTFCRIAADNSDEMWEFNLFDSFVQASDFVRKSDRIDIACVDVTAENGVELAEQIRKQFRSGSIVLISDIGMSPVIYIKPTICANSLILRPYSREEACDTLKAVIDQYIRDIFYQDNNESFVFENKNGKQLIPFDLIYYFEARNKKIMLCTEFEEYDFYGTLDELENTLPEQFLRCHRSYIISVEKISLIKLSLHTVRLNNGCIIPVSRTYSKHLKEISL